VSELGGAGCAYLVGAGPGSLDLVTVRALELVKSAEVIVYDYLVNPALLERARDEAEIIYVGKTASAHTLTQGEINALLVEKARAGKTVVRLKGGDPYVFGRGGEEGIALARAGLPFEVVPGVSSAIAAASYAGIPVTHRNVASQVTFITGHEDPTKPESAIDWSQLARLGGTKVFLMGVERLRDIAAQLLAHGAAVDTPVALVRWGTTARQETLTGTLATIADLAEKHQFKPPAVTIVGEVVNLRPELNWFEKLPFFGQRVVVTRARRQSSELRRRLARLGADVLEIPTIRIERVPLPDAQQSRFASFGRFFDWAVFSSPNGVERFFEEMRSGGIDLRVLGSVKIAALGPATSGSIEKRGLRVDLQPGTFTNEALASAFDETDVKEKRFCLVQGRLADPGLADHLVSRGSVVESWVFYDTQPETKDISGARARFQQEGAHWVVFTSASTVENWHRLGLKPEAGARIPRVVSIGPVTSAALQKLGYEIAAEAESATLESIVETIRRLHIE
jgi:uroporphyrinogen III methyltransferase / synthase